MKAENNENVYWRVYVEFVENFVFISVQWK